MTRLARIAMVAGFVGVAAACGKPPEQQQVEQIQRNAQQLAQDAAQMSNNSQDVAKGFEAMARGVAASASGTANGMPVDPVDFEKLQEVLPDVSGWEQSDSHGERMTAPMSLAIASIRYRKGDAEITEKITDSAFNPLMVAPLTMMMATGYAKETDSGYEKAATIAGYPAFEKWDKSDKSGELTVFVNKRFVVELEGSVMLDNKELKAFLGHTDLKRLAALQ